MSAVINKAAVRRLALDSANERRARVYKGAVDPFRAVSAAFLHEVESELRRLVERRAAEHWQKGVTLT